MHNDLQSSTHDAFSDIVDKTSEPRGQPTAPLPNVTNFRLDSHVPNE